MCVCACVYAYMWVACKFTCEAGSSLKKHVHTHVYVNILVCMCARVYNSTGLHRKIESIWPKFLVIFSDKDCTENPKKGFSSDLFQIFCEVT